METPVQQLTSVDDILTSHSINEDEAEKVAVLMCRLCANILTAEKKPESESSGDKKWVHLMKICGPSSHSVQEVVAKYLPKDILGNVAESERCPVVCLGCYRSLSAFMTFIDKIIKEARKTFTSGKRL